MRLYKAASPRHTFQDVSTRGSAQRTLDFAIRIRRGENDDTPLRESVVHGSQRICASEPGRRRSINIMPGRCRRNPASACVASTMGATIIMSACDPIIALRPSRRTRRFSSGEDTNWAVVFGDWTHVHLCPWPTAVSIRGGISWAPPMSKLDPRDDETGRKPAARVLTHAPGRSL